MPAGEGPDVVGIATTILDGVVAHFAASEVELPERRVIAPGDTRLIAVDDCEQVIVTCARIGWGADATGGLSRPTGINLSSTTVRFVEFAVQIVRCTVDAEGPVDADVLTGAGVAFLRDMGLLSQALTELCGDHGPLSRHGKARAGDVVPVGPGGGPVASEGSITVTVKHLV